MNLKLMKTSSWAFLTLIILSLFLGVRADWLIYATATAVILVALLFFEFEGRHSDSRMVSLVGVLVALTACSRQLLHGIEFSPVFFIVILTGYVYGFTPGFAVGALSMFISNFFLGHGPWTPFQMFGLGLTGAFASKLPKNQKYAIILLTFYSVCSAFLYGALVDVFSWIAFIPTHTLESFIGIISSGMIANLARAVGNIFFMIILGPVLLKVFLRFKRRLTYVRVNTIRDGPT